MPVREENILSNTFKLIDYATSAGRKRGYVPATAVGNIISFPHKMENNCTVYSDHLQTFMPQSGVFRQKRAFGAFSKSWIISALTILQGVY